MDISTYFGIAEDAIRRYNLKPEDCKGEAPGVWYLGRGPALARIFMWTEEKSQVPYVRIACPVMYVAPEHQNYDLLVRLPELNAYYIGIKFVKSDNDIILGVDREMIGLDSGEMFAMVNRVLNIGAEQIPLLKEQFAVDNKHIKMYENNVQPA
jgi:hypothetical protein